MPRGEYGSTKVGEMIGPSEPSPRPIPCVKVVLPAPRSPAGDDHISWLEQLGQSLSQPHHLHAGRNLDHEWQRLGQDHAVRDRAVDDEAAVLPEGDEVGNSLVRVVRHARSRG